MELVVAIQRVVVSSFASNSLKFSRDINTSNCLSIKGFVVRDISGYFLVVRDVSG